MSHPHPSTSHVATRKLVSITEAAGMLGVHPRTIRRYVASGVVAASKVGPRTIRIDIDDLASALHPIPSAREGA